MNVTQPQRKSARTNLCLYPVFVPTRTTAAHQPAPNGPDTAATPSRPARNPVVIAAIGFAVLMVGVLVVAVVFPSIAGGPSQDVPLSGLGKTTDDNTSGAWIRALAGFGLTGLWIVLLVFQLHKAKRRRNPPPA
jgi:hypothetical protein